MTPLRADLAALRAEIARLKEALTKAVNRGQPYSKETQAEIDAALAGIAEPAVEPSQTIGEALEIAHKREGGR